MGLTWTLEVIAYHLSSNDASPPITLIIVSRTMERYNFLIFCENAKVDTYFFDLTTTEMGF